MVDVRRRDREQASGVDWLDAQARQVRPGKQSCSRAVESQVSSDQQVRVSSRVVSVERGTDGWRVGVTKRGHSPKVPTSNRGAVLCTTRTALAG